MSTTVDVSVSQSRTQDIMDCSAGGLLKQHVGMLTSHNCVGRYVNAGHIFVGSLAVNCRDVTEPANIRIRRMRISCAKSVGCGCGFVVRSKLPAIIVTVIQLNYLKLSSCN